LPAAAQAAAEARQAGREAALAHQPRWGLEGRIALSNGRQGGSGRLDWQQDGDRYVVALSAPVTRQSWRVVGEPGTVRLEGLDGGPRVGSDASDLLREATGWDIPVAASSTGCAARRRRARVRPSSASAPTAGSPNCARAAGPSPTRTGASPRRGSNSPAG